IRESPQGATPALSETAFGAHGSYLITGGLGGLGLSLAGWMVENGARHLALVGRHAATAAEENALMVLREAGANVVVINLDVAQPDQVGQALAEIDQSMPPLRGVVHAAGVLDDGILMHLDRERFESVMSPKLAGAWNLHRLTLDKALDFFILFSSSAALLGAPGQGSYAAANAFLDALAHYRRRLGLKALSINWGNWLEVGLAAKREPSDPS